MLEDRGLMRCPWDPCHEIAETPGLVAEPGVQKGRGEDGKEAAGQSLSTLCMGRASAWYQLIRTKGMRCGGFYQD